MVRILLKFTSSEMVGVLIVVSGGVMEEGGQKKVGVEMRSCVVAFRYDFSEPFVFVFS